MSAVDKIAKDEAAVLEKIAQFPEPYDDIGQRLHELIMSTVPELKPRLWYGMPGYAKDGPVLCFFRVDGDLMTFGLSEKANFTREEGADHQLMGAAWVVGGLDDATGRKIADILRRAVA